MAETMRALVVRAPGDYALERVPVPQPPPGGLLVKISACGLCGSDLRTLQSGHRRVTLPWIIGHEICGTVVETGPGYSGPWSIGEALAVGPLAYCGACAFCLDGRHELCENYREIGQAWPGGFAEYVAVPEACVSHGTIQALPAGLDPAYAAISEPVSSCVHAQERGAIGLGDTVAIIGPGPVGCTHISLARSHGAERIFVIGVQPDRLRLAEAFCPNAVIDATAVDPVAEVRRLTGGRGADVVITATAAPVAPLQAVEMAAKGGRVLLFGGLPAGQSRPGLDLNLVHYNGLQLIGTTIFAPRHQRLALRLLAGGRVPGERLVTHRLPLDRFAEGVSLANEGIALKVVFLP